jgi:MFS family permease
MSQNNNYLVSFMIWLSITMFYCYQYILRVIPNTIMPELMSQFNVGAAEFGTFAGIYYIGYIVIHIPIGLALSKWGGKLVLPICISLTSAGLAPLVYSDSWNFVLIGRLMVGLGSSAAIVGALQIFRIIFEKNFTRMLGIMVCFGLMTAVYANKPLTQVINMAGIKTVINALILGGFALAILTYFLIPNVRTKAHEESIWRSVKTIIFNYKLIFVSILAGLMIGPLEGFADAWGSGFLNTVYDIDRAISGTIIASILTGMCIGCVVLPFVAEKANSHYLVTLASAIIMAGCFTFLLMGYGDIIGVRIICLLIGIFSAYQVVIIAKISSFVPQNLSGMAAAIANMIMMAFGSIFHTIIGNSMAKLWGGILIDNVRIYSKEAYIKSISVIPAAMTVAIIGFSLLLIIKACRKKRIVASN